MRESHAAGRKTENHLGQMALHLDRQLARLTEALGECLDAAAAVPREQDEYGHHRAGEITHAMQIARTSAKLVASLAKLDREFRHNISVSRISETADAPPPPVPLRVVPPERIDGRIDGRIDRGDPPPNS